MKTKNSDLSNLDIDKILSEKYDLGFLLDQRKDKRAILPPSIIDVLRFIPQFNEAISRIRDDLGINPQTIKHSLSRLIGKRKFLDYLDTSRQIARAINFPLDQDFGFINDQLKDWKMKKFPLLPKKVTVLRLKALGKAPHTWQDAIEDYILFEKNSPIPIIYRRPSTEVEMKQDPKTLEPYFELKIYSDTNLKSFSPILSQIKKMQKKLPNYSNMDAWEENLIISRFLQFVLRKNLKLTQQQTVNWLKSHDLQSPEYQHVSQEVNRFKKLFILTPQK